ncbi:MAG: protein-tyrosine phosphatase-like protein [Olpidium bornovanus]|uniref:Protein-tyrosine phosphatase-like protein n=1 Tax=Olpidium bornovanus TaxID=278681 RepID=A0A8H7ZQQ3_9FUNG|nr:MAG: protein-tyrosine phosphatase-like protein [Olpidium bornovanus]
MRSHGAHSSSGSGTAVRLINQPTLVEHKNLRFLIADAPSDSNLPLFIKDWSFSDGEPPPSDIVDNWLDLIERRFGRDPSAQPDSALCVHCVAGLGRAPVLVAIALIEHGMAPVDALVYVRERRRGAINNKQLKYIEGYKRRTKSKCLIM